MARLPIVWSEEAVARLAEEARAIARSRPRTARWWKRRLWRAVTRLGDFPWSGRVVPELQDPAIREVIVVPYRILYEVEPERVVVLTLVHHRQSLTGEGPPPSDPPG